MTFPPLIVSAPAPPIVPLVKLYVPLLTIVDDGATVLEIETVPWFAPANVTESPSKN